MLQKSRDQLKLVNNVAQLEEKLNEFRAKYKAHTSFKLPFSLEVSAIKTIENLGCAEDLILFVKESVHRAFLREKDSYSALNFIRD